MVLNNVVDAAAVDSNVLKLWTSEHHQHADELHVMCSWGPWPVQPIVVNTRLPGIDSQCLMLQLCGFNARRKVQYCHRCPFARLSVTSTHLSWATWKV